ncbi:hypothetical protein PENTCL1PPCAC_20246, partial [Pristionchus entomophagus]
GGEEVELLAIRCHHVLGRVEHSKVGGAVDDDSLDRDEESSVEADQTVRLDSLDQAVRQTFELSAFGLSDVSGETGSGEVERVHEAQRSGSCGSSGDEVAEEEPTEVLLLVDPFEEYVLERVLEGEVEGLCREVTDDVGQIASATGSESLLLGHTHEHIHDTLVTLISSNTLRDILNLEQQLDAFDGCDGGLGDGGRRASRGQIEEELRRVERLGLLLLLLRCSRCCSSASLVRAHLSARVVKK